MASRIEPDSSGGFSSRAVYYYHKDHLGSSTYMTDGAGVIREQAEYTPWGETWDITNNTLTYVDFLYTGKERDATGLYYFGARYYDPRISLWLSADPILDRYIDGAPNSGVYNSLNLSLYSYAAQNPMKYTDPDGRTHILVVAAAGVLVYMAIMTTTVTPGRFDIETPTIWLPTQTNGIIDPATGRLKGFIDAESKLDAKSDNNSAGSEAKGSGENAGEKSQEAAPGAPNPNDFDKNRLKKQENKPTKDDSKVPKPKDFKDPSKSPGEGWKWEGGKKGSWHNKSTKQSLRPDFNNPQHEPHYDYKGPEGKARIYENGTIEWK